VLTFDDAVEALAVAERRRLLAELLEYSSHDGHTLAVANGAAPADAVGRRMRWRHRHLPKLADLGVIEWDGRDDEVTKGPAFDELAPLLELLVEHEEELPLDLF